MGRFYNHIGGINHSGVGTGITNYNELLSSVTPAVQVTSDFLTVLCNALYFAIYNGAEESGLQALEVIHNKALESLYSDVLLVSF